ncbi:hypothetical protein V8V91_19965 [Algoriphagus halophilus]|uniref:hypothetical protein n=1 Tax=Algoriphagus halophilus TaxID=226505 RepID=UPI00358FD446
MEEENFHPDKAAKTLNLKGAETLNGNQLSVKLKQIFEGKGSSSELVASLMSKTIETPYPVQIRSFTLTGQNYQGLFRENRQSMDVFFLHGRPNQ